MKITYFPTEKMIVDYSSELAQVSLFAYQRNAILGILIEDFATHKRWREDSSKKHGLWDDEEYILHKI